MLDESGPELDCSAFNILCKALGCCRRYEKAQKPLTAFDADISKYGDLSDEVLAENAAESIKFLFVDCGSLKQVCHLCCLMLLPHSFADCLFDLCIDLLHKWSSSLEIGTLSCCIMSLQVLHCLVQSVVATASFACPVMLLCGSALWPA